VPIRWEKGGEGRMARAEKDLVAVRSTLASAPGSRLVGSTEGGTLVRVKVARCRRLPGSPDGAIEYLIEGRLLDASRDVMAELAALAAVEGGGGEAQ
jgi:hypothetical protein